jgi:hypothetical protein
LVLDFEEGLIVKKKISIDQLNEMLEEKSEFEMSDKRISLQTGSIGRKLSAIAKTKVGAASKGRKHSDSWKMDMSIRMKGRTMSDDQISKISASAKNRKTDECTVDGITIFPNKKALSGALGRGLNGSRSPNFRYLNPRVALKWFNNGVEQAKCECQPDGWKPGRLLSNGACEKVSKKLKKPCTLDGITFYESRNAMATVLGCGKASFKHPNFRYVSREEYEAYLKGKK